MPHINRNYYPVYPQWGYNPYIYQRPVFYPPVRGYWPVYRPVPAQCGCAQPIMPRGGIWWRWYTLDGGRFVPGRGPIPKPQNNHPNTHPNTAPDNKPKTNPPGPGKKETAPAGQPPAGTPKTTGAPKTPVATTSAPADTKVEVTPSDIPQPPIPDTTA